MKDNSEKMKMTKTSSLDCARLTEKSVRDEESLANRSVDEDKKILFEITNEIKEKLLEILSIKTENKELKRIEILKKEICMLLLDLKKLNRIDKIRCRNMRDKVYESKQKVDVFHLQLQNLLYEGKFIQQEINKCLDFRSKIEDIELVDLDTFLNNAPKEMVEDEEIKHDAHKCTIERLKFELQERIKLTQELKIQNEEKKKIIGELENRLASLENLKPLVSKIVETVQPVYKLLDITEEQQPMEES